jgi:hypothetical protein
LEGGRQETLVTQQGVCEGRDTHKGQGPYRRLYVHTGTSGAGCNTQYSHPWYRQDSNTDTATRVQTEPHTTASAHHLGLGGLVRVAGLTMHSIQQVCQQRFLLCLLNSNDAVQSIQRAVDKKARHGNSRAVSQATRQH